MDSAGAVGVTVATAGLAAGMVGRVLPPIPEVRGTDPALATPAVREQLTRTGAVVLMLGVGASILSRSPWPAIGVVAVTAWLWFEYDTAARRAADSPAAAAMGTPAAAASRRYAA